MTRPTSKAVAVRKNGSTTYKLYNNGELWQSGDASLPDGFLCGYVTDPEHIDTAIDNYEEEMRCLMASARAEFGL